MKTYSIDIGIPIQGQPLAEPYWIFSTETVKANRQSAAIKQAEKIFLHRKIRVRLITPPLARHPLAK